MITNERQYKITRVQLERLKEALKPFIAKKAMPEVKPSRLAKVKYDALISEFENLTSQLQEYEVLKSGAVQILKASSLEELPSILIRARIAKGLSQRKLAEMIGIKEQQIQRYEAEEYASASLKRFSEIANALNLDINEVAEFGKSKERIDANKSNFAWDKSLVKELYLRNWFEGFQGSLEVAIDNAEELVEKFVTESLDKPISTFARQRIRSGGVVNQDALLAWQCRVISLAKRMKLKNTFKHNMISAAWFKALARLSRNADGPKEAVKYLEEYGIRLIVVPHLNNTYLDGAALLLSDGPVIGITLRYDRLDHFWFVLFHELVHVVKDLCKGKVEVIFDDLEESADENEKKTDQYTGNLLIPENKWEESLARYVRSKEVITRFADEIEVSPSIVAGKIRNEAENYTILTDMIGQGEVQKLFSDIDLSR